MSPRPAAPRRHLPTSPFNNKVGAEAVQYEVDDWVSHDRYGLGRVLSVDGTQTVVVDFRGGTVLTVGLPSSKLSKI